MGKTETKKSYGYPVDPSIILAEDTIRHKNTETMHSYNLPADIGINLAENTPQCRCVRH